MDEKGPQRSKIEPIVLKKKIGAARLINCFFGLRPANTARPTIKKLQKGKQKAHKNNVELFFKPQGSQIEPKVSLLYFRWTKNSPKIKNGTQKIKNGAQRIQNGAPKVENRAQRLQNGVQRVFMVPQMDE